MIAGGRTMDGDRGAIVRDSMMERVLEGIGVALGIAIGPAYAYARMALDVEEKYVGRKEVRGEIDRFEDAVSKSERDLHKIVRVAREKLGEGSAEFFEAQLLMLRDTVFYEAVVEHLRTDRKSADYAVQTVIGEHRNLLEASENEYFQERADDMLDLQHRVLRHLRRGRILATLDHESIIVSNRLAAADVVLFSRKGMLGTVVDHGGVTSHVSIMVRALGLPAVVNTHDIMSEVATGDMLIVDGFEGRVIVHPGAETLALYRSRQERYRRRLHGRKRLASLPPETVEGHRVRLAANLEFMEELEHIEEYGAEGVGLFRTEVPFLMEDGNWMSEEEQFRIYRSVAENVGKWGVTIRVLDFGGDKMLPMDHQEPNPFLGWQGIRILLDTPELLIPQLRAILRASDFGRVRIMLPMVTELEEVATFKEVLGEVYAQLRKEGIAFDPDVPVGIMVEVPAVALKAAWFAREVDFFSIGTNDLTQYSLAVDRSNDLVADKYQELDPAILQLIRKTVDAGHARGIPVSVCGELAARPLVTPILLGLEVDELSASPVYLPQIKRVIRAIRLQDARELAARVLEVRDASGVRLLLEGWLDKHVPDLVRRLKRW